jgi:PTS system nitrogen regulatory IIA component
VIDVVDVREGLEPGSLGRECWFLFGVQDGRARLVPDPASFDPKNAEFAVVLRKRIPGLSRLITHVEIIEGRASYVDVVRQLAHSAGRLVPELASAIEAAATQTPAAVGNRVAIPHAYIDGLPASTCLMAVAKDGVDGLEAPDGQPVQIVCLLLSSTEQPEQHLSGLATLGALAVEQDLIRLLTSQQAPERVRKLLEAQS